MQTIQVDNDVYNYLERKVTGFGDTPNQVLRRILKIEKNSEKPSAVSIKKIRTSGSKAPKTNILDLIEINSLKEGQELHLIDYQEHKVKNIKAIIRGNQLEYNNQFYSMSALAKELLNKEGFDSSEYRGPRFWCTDDGKSIQSLWAEYLKNNIK